jgi:hypothetical protein
MSEPPPNPDAAFLIYRDGTAFALHMRCCDIHLKLDSNDQALEEAIARYLSRVHGYIGSIDHEISLEALLRKLPIRPEATWMDTDVSSRGRARCGPDRESIDVEFRR